MESQNNLEIKGNLVSIHSQNVIEEYSKLLTKLDRENDGLLDLYSNLHSNQSTNNDIIFWQKRKHAIHKLLLECNSIQMFPEEFLKLEGFKYYFSSHLIIHEKGSSQCHCLNYSLQSGYNKTHISIGDFNNFYRIIKKSKNKTFNRTQVSHIDLDFLGTFLAREFTLPKYNIILVLSRNDFLKPTKEEVVYFDTFNNVLPPLLNSLLISESTNKKIVSLIQCLYELPYPITITRSNEPIFKNKAYKDIISVDDITLLDKQILNNQYELKIYGMKEEEGHTSDIFHFQRISLLGELLNTLKHELSNPLFGLGLASELVYSELSDDDENKELVFEITNNIKRSQSIIDNFSKLYQNINTTRPVLVKKIIHESLTLTKSETRGVEKVTQFQKTIDDNYEIMINPTWLVQILFNLIVNSAQAMKEMVERRPLIQLSCFDKDNFLNIIVSDNGPGIDEEKFELLFKPFYTTKNNGTGLGLPISKNLAQKMNGDLSAKLNKPNPGITFTLKLPVNYENSHH